MNLVLTQRRRSSEQSLSVQGYHLSHHVYCCNMALIYTHCKYVEKNIKFSKRFPGTEVFGRLSGFLKQSLIQR